MNKLADQRDRDRFATELGANFAVSASAGAGKTTAIVRRVAEIARRAESVSALARLVVVTYTEAAATELRVRAREEIFKNLPLASGGRQRVIAAFGGAFFGTIHAFCLKLLGEEGRRLSLPARPALLEPGDERLWLRFAGEAPELADSDAARRVFRHYTFEQVLRLARKLDTAAAEQFTAAELSPSAPVVAVSGLLDFKPSRGAVTEKTRAHMKKLAAWFERYAADDDGFLMLPNFDGGNQEFLDAVGDAFRPYATWLDAHAAALAGRLALAYRDYRAAHGFVTYDDMVTWAQQLLADGKILRRLRAREYVVILDEAQDTHPAMFRILTELTRPQDSALYTWPDQADATPPTAGRFCFVGDEQQAIYDRSDLKLYRRYVDAFADGRGGELLDFSVTMRCPRQVIGAVNRMFHDRLDQPPLVTFKALVARPGAAVGAVTILPLTLTPGKCKVDEERRDECAQVADWLAARGLGGLGVAHWGEVAVLAPRVDWLGVVAAALRARGLPCCLLSSRARKRDMPAYAWPVALLLTLTQPAERFELLGVLREIFGVSDAELLEAHRAEKSGLDLRARAGDFSRTAAALELLRGLRADLTAGGCHALARRLLTVTQLRGRIEAVGGDAAPLADFERSALTADLEGTGLFAWLDELRRGLDQAPPLASGGAGEIQLLSCHKSKGLQWPVVVTVGLGNGLRAQQVEYPRVDRADGQFVPHFSPLTRTDEAKEARSVARDWELQRLFYVTLTRAQRLLVLPDSSGFYSIRKHSFAELARWAELDLPALAGGEIVNVSGAATDDGARAAELAASPSAAALAAAQNIWRRVLPHKLAVHAEPEEEREFAAEQVTGGLAYGVWWHGVLQYFPWASPSAAQAAYVATQLAAAPPACRTRGARELALFMKSALREKLLADGEHFLAELPFSAPLTPGEAMEGVLDLLVTRGDGGCVVVDWKTNRTLAGETTGQFHARLREIYERQLTAYADLLAQKFNHPVSGCWLYATVSGEKINVN
ncbi:MAG: UvrD-helicase domain-containing protein [Verrucomicrobiales bacterium]|jgi:ATP-dependent exoDNAse (exonuclease V) beta subunit|nr:UvrD-helicase domain-containing protein [Verrucomicrobiales bacterium]